MGRQAPVVNTGMKPPRASRAEATSTRREVGAGIYARISALMRGQQPDPEKVKPQTPYEVVFQSKFRTHRIQIDSPADVIDNRGRKSMGRTLFAQFRDSVFSIPKWIKLPDAEFFLGVLRGHPQFGNDFWEEKDNTHDIRVAQVARVVDMLEKNQDIKDTVLNYLTERDFVDPQVDGLGAAAPSDVDLDALAKAPARTRRPVARPAAHKPQGRKPGRPIKQSSI